MPCKPVCCIFSAMLRYVYVLFSFIFELIAQAGRIIDKFLRGFHVVVIVHLFVIVCIRILEQSPFPLARLRSGNHKKPRKISQLEREDRLHKYSQIYCLMRAKI